MIVELFAFIWRILGSTGLKCKKVSNLLYTILWFSNTCTEVRVHPWFTFVFFK